MDDAILIDTGFWIALFDPKDERHAAARAKADYVEDYPIVVPWPLTYEIPRTRFVRRPAWVAGLDARLGRHDAIPIDDSPYRERAYSLAVASSVDRPMSMADVLCRLLIEDPNVRFGALLTFNRGDFSDVCYANDVEML